MNRRAFLGALGDAAGLGVVAAAAAAVPALASADEPVVTFSGWPADASPEDLARAIKDAMIAAELRPLSLVLLAPPWVDEAAIRHAHEALARYVSEPGTVIVLPDGWRVEWAYCGLPCVARSSEATP